MCSLASSCFPYPAWTVLAAPSLSNVFCLALLFCSVLQFWGSEETSYLFDKVPAAELCLYPSVSTAHRSPPSFAVNLLPSTGGSPFLKPCSDQCGPHGAHDKFLLPFFSTKIKLDQRHFHKYRTFLFLKKKRIQLSVTKCMK